MVYLLKQNPTRERTRGRDGPEEEQKRKKPLPTENSANPYPSLFIHPPSSIHLVTRTIPILEKGNTHTKEYIPLANSIRQQEAKQEH